MKVQYFEDTDTLYIEFQSQQIAQTRDLDENTLLDLDATTSSPTRRGTSSTPGTWPPGPQQNIRFADLKKVCEAYFGQPRQSSTSHLIYKPPWPGDPRVYIQNASGQAKAYQVRQVLQAIDKLEHGNEH